jgi:hypothetical protein
MHFPALESPIYVVICFRTQSILGERSFLFERQIEYSVILGRNNGFICDEVIAIRSSLNWIFIHALKTRYFEKGQRKFLSSSSRTLNIQLCINICDLLIARANRPLGKVSRLPRRVTCWSAPEKRRSKKTVTSPGITISFANIVSV